MESFADDNAPNGRGVLQNKHYEPVSDRAGQLIERFKATKLRHHEDLHAGLAESAECQKLFLEHRFEYQKYIDNYFSKYTKKKPRGPETSHDLMYCSYQAFTPEDRRKAGLYARVVDYMIAKKVTNFEAFLKKHTYSGVLELARQDKRPAREKEERPFIKVYLDDPTKNLLTILKNCPTDVSFTLFCDAEAGRNPKVTAQATPVIKSDEFAFTRKEATWWRAREARMKKAEQILLKEVKAGSSGSARAQKKVSK